MTPYILEWCRKEFEPELSTLMYKLEQIDDKNLGGDVNYIVSCLIHAMRRDGWNYDAIQRVRGMLDGVKSEFEARLAVPYEISARKRNGDIITYKDLPFV